MIFIIFIIFVFTIGQTEQDPLEIYDPVVTCLNESLKKIDNTSSGSYSIVGLGLTNQRETSILWNKKTGKPYHNAIVWNDTRTSATCESFSEADCPYTSEKGKDRFRYTTTQKQTGISNELALYL